VSDAWQVFADHLKLAVRLTPSGGRDAIEGLQAVGDGETWIKARVSAAPEKGKANKALVTLLARSLGIPKSAVTFVSGETARKKILRIDGDPKDLMVRLKAVSKG
jgi:hypothetical protein